MDLIGEKGDQGQRGPAGLKGDRGNDGERGEPGLAGPRGYLVSFQFPFNYIQTMKFCKILFKNYQNSFIL